MITTRELAKLAGVSQSTVSRSLNDNPGVDPMIKERVRSIAKEHGYVYEGKGKKKLRVLNRKFIGIVMLRNISFLDNFFLNQISSLLIAAVENSNYHAVMIQECYGYQGVSKLNDLMKLNVFDGFIIVNQQYDEILPRHLKDMKIPYILLIYHNRLDDKKDNVIDTDNYLGAYMATEHLIKLGHKRIIALTTSLAEHNDRMQGYREALTDNGLEYDPKLVLSTDCNYNAAYRVTLERIKTFRSATACFAQFDLGVLGICNALKKNGINVPKDFSIVGFDDLDISKIFDPALTTIKQPLEQLTELAVNELISSINSGNLINPCVYLKPELIERDSAAAAPDCSKN